MSNKVAVLVDSACSFTEKFLNDNNAYVLPLSLSDSHNKLYDDDGVQITSKILFDEIAAGNEFKSSSTALGAISEKITELLKTHDTVVFFPVSYGLSTQYQSAKILEDDFDGKFIIVKTVCAAFETMWMVQEFTKQLADGIEVKEAIKIVEAQQKKMATFFSLDDVGGLVKGGRVTGAIVKVFKLLKLKPIVQTEVKNHFAGMGKNFEMNTTKILNRIKKLFSAHKLDKSNILHFGVLDGGISAAQIETMKKKAENIFNIDYDLIDVKPVPTCVLCHTRKGSYGYAIEANFEHENSKWKDD